MLRGRARAKFVYSIYEFDVCTCPVPRRAWAFHQITCFVYKPNCIYTCDTLCISEFNFVAWKVSVCRMHTPVFLNMYCLYGKVSRKVSGFVRAIRMCILGRLRAEIC